MKEYVVKPTHFGVDRFEAERSENVTISSCIHEVFEQIKDGSRKSYIKAWQDLKSFINGHNFEESHPGEGEFIAYLKHLRLLFLIIISA